MTIKTYRVKKDGKWTAIQTGLNYVSATCPECGRHIYNSLHLHHEHGWSLAAAQDYLADHGTFYPNGMHGKKYAPGEWKIVKKK